MSQGEVLEFLKKNKGKWLSSRDIEPYIDSNIHSITSSLRKLRDTNMVHYKDEIISQPIGTKNLMFKYKYKR